MTIPRKPQLNQQNLNSEKKGMGITVLSCYNHSRTGCLFAKIRLSICIAPELFRSCVY